jgi:hypothetical protein
MPKTLTGAELDLDDAPARECDLFIVDGNNLAYRAFFALPEELATTAVTASWRGSFGLTGIGSAGGSTTIVARVPRFASDSIPSPSSG